MSQWQPPKASEWHPMDEGECHGEWAVNWGSLMISMHEASHYAELTDKEQIRALRDALTRLIDQEPA